MKSLEFPLARCPVYLESFETGGLKATVICHLHDSSDDDSLASILPALSSFPPSLDPGLLWDVLTCLPSKQDFMEFLVHAEYLIIHFVFRVTEPNHIRIVSYILTGRVKAKRSGAEFVGGGRQGGFRILEGAYRSIRS